MAFHLAAPLDRTARLLTAFTWGLAGALVALGVLLLAIADLAAGILVLAVSLLLGVLCVVYRRLQPVSYEVDGAGLTVRRRLATPRRFEGNTTLMPGATLGLRVMGSGGLYGYLGRFRLRGAATGSANAFVTDRSRVVVMDVGGGRVALSPLDGEALSDEVGGPRGDAND